MSCNRHASVAPAPKESSVREANCEMTAEQYQDPQHASWRVKIQEAQVLVHEACHLIQSDEWPGVCYGAAAPGPLARER